MIVLAMRYPGNSVGAEIESEMDVVELGTTDAHGIAVACDARAAPADAIVVVGHVEAAHQLPPAR